MSSIFARVATAMALGNIKLEGDTDEPACPDPAATANTLTSTAEPWLHVGLGLMGAFLGHKLAAVYDDTTDELNRQYASYASLPSWAYSQLTAEELSAELRDQRLATLRAKFDALAAVEEAEFKAAQAAKEGDKPAAPLRLA